MSTRSVVAIPTATGWKGRYVHGGGYPTWNGAKLHALVNRDGYNAVTSTIVTGENYGWSSLDLDATVLPEYLSDGRFVFVPGYGVAYTSVVIKGRESSTPQARESQWLTNANVGTSWTEWVYVLGETGIDVYICALEPIKVGHVRYDESVDAFVKIEKAGEAAAAA